MTYFPFFIDIIGKPCLIVGGGKTALRKVRKLLPFRPEITAVSLSFIPEFDKLNDIKLMNKAFEESDLDGMFMAVSATNDKLLNMKISKLCEERKILCNTVDDPDSCGFIFPALINSADTVIAVSTGGSSPAFAAYLRKTIEASLPERIYETAEAAARLRPYLLKNLPDERSRKLASEQIIKLCMESEEFPTDSRLLEILDDTVKENL